MNQDKYIIEESLYLPIWLNISQLVILIFPLLFLLYSNIQFLTSTKNRTTKKNILTLIEHIIELTIFIILLVIACLGLKHKYDINYTYWKNKNTLVYLPNIDGLKILIMILLYIFMCIYFNICIFIKYKKFIRTTTVNHKNKMSNKIKAFINYLTQRWTFIILSILYIMYVTILILIIPLFIVSVVYTEKLEYEEMVAIYDTNTYISLILDIVNIFILSSCIILIVITEIYMLLSSVLKCQNNVSIIVTDELPLNEIDTTDMCGAVSSIVV